MSKLSRFIDHTILKPNVTTQDISKLCQEAIKYDFYSVCVPPSYVNFAKQNLLDKNPKICTVIGFPLGFCTTKIKILESIDAVENGADEIDIVLNISKAVENDFGYIKNEIQNICSESKAKKSNLIIKIILETCLLTDIQKLKISEILCDTPSDFVKTSTGFSTSGANLQDIVAIKNLVQNKILIKASGGIKTREDFDKFLDAGADRIGTSNGISIIEGTNKISDY